MRGRRRPRPRRSPRRRVRRSHRARGRVPGAFDDWLTSGGLPPSSTRSSTPGCRFLRAAPAGVGGAAVRRLIASCGVPGPPPGHSRRVSRTGTLQGSLPACCTTGYELGGFYDEMFEDARRRRAGAAAALRRAWPRQLAAMEREELRRAAELANRSFLHQGITFTVYSRRRAGHRADLPVRPDPAHHPGRRVGVDRGGPDAAHQALNLFLHDVYHDAGDPAGRRRAAPTWSCSARTSGARSSASTCRDDQLHPHRRHRPGPRRRRRATWCWRTTCASPSGVSYVLENRPIMTRVFPDWFARPRRAAGRRLPRAAAREPARARRARRGRGEPDGRAAHAGHLQLGLLRARLPGAADGHRAGRGPRPLRRSTTASTCARPAAASRST